MRGLIVLALAVISLASFAGRSAAEEVTLEYLGLELTANLEMAPGKSFKDGAVLLVHDTQAHGRVELMAALQDGLRDQASTRSPSRWDSASTSGTACSIAGLSRITGMRMPSTRLPPGCAGSRTRERQSVTVAGHGRGANQAALYAINKLDKTVKRLVLIAPLMQTPEKTEAEYRARFGKPLRPELGKAEELVATERGNQLTDVAGFLNCQHAQVTAGAFADYYGVNEKFKTTNLLQSIKIPVLLAVGDADPNLGEIQAAQGEFAGYKTVTFAIIPGADQDFRDAGADEVAKKIKEFTSHRLQG